jgi:large subunit ribosomal protein L22
MASQAAIQPQSLFTAEPAKPKDTAFSVVRKIPVSPRKINAIARQIRGLSVREAEMQMSFHRQQNAQYVKKGVILAKANAENNYGLDGNRLVISAHAFLRHHGACV